MTLHATAPAPAVEPAAAAPAVRFNAVHKSFGTLEVLKGISFAVGRGEVVCLIGRSGSGKSTALRCINGLERITTGSIDVCGHVVSPDGRADLHAVRKRVGIVFQSYNLFPHLTVEQNITLAPRRVKKTAPAEARAIAADVLAKVGLSDKRDSYPEQLSGGQQQRVAIARALAMQPEVMLFDEVTSALDPELTGEVLKVMEDLARGGMTMVLVTHEMAFASRVADKIIFMHQGRVHEAGPRDMLSRPETPELRQFVGTGL
ncbi:amino acid ABC transporter ATP-binding protein [Lichenibacterium ramalinae]|uniref:Amino acid ABC transporter ATP-binding protein n=1 Tax=Lichenibacterium ramalinae TaxID=2316527 RepID=A0A4Q2RE66_9HYPH|nr:amino acid ABC transporter ATP-binding protein [Lichenibacterium ramalinae]RYB04348.1 amino acid ABC transporter ATP-binding protein [Lichenibacterium ramalinae]